MNASSGMLMMDVNHNYMEVHFRLNSEQMEMMMRKEWCMTMVKKYMGYVDWRGAK